MPNARSAVQDLPVVKGGEKFLCDAAAPIRAEFLSQKWIPFLRELKDELLSAEARCLSGFGPEELLPSQRRVEELTEKCASLTLAWHGARNYSVIYEWLMELHDVDRSTYPYRFEELPMERSADGWVRVVDGNVRKSLYTTPKPGDAALDVGGLKQFMGDSAIDNTVLPNIMPAGEAHLLLAGGAIKRMYAKRLAGQQADILNAVSAYFLAKGFTEWSDLRSAQRPARARAATAANRSTVADGAAARWRRGAANDRRQRAFGSERAAAGASTQQAQGEKEWGKDPHSRGLPVQFLAQ